MLGRRKGNKLNQYVTDYVVYDLETTGTSCRTDRVVELSAVKVVGGEIVSEFSSLVNPHCSIPYGASQVNGITDDMVKDAPDFATVLKDFLDFAEDFILVGHNIGAFDMNFIYRDCEDYFGEVPGNDYVDTLTYARSSLPGLKHYKLTDLAAHYGISTEGAHRALNDCRMNQQIFERLAKEPRKKSSAALKLCPRCGGELRKRNGKFGEFYGCSGYPVCRYTENI